MKIIDHDADNDHHHDEHVEDVDRDENIDGILMIWVVV